MADIQAVNQAVQKAVGAQVQSRTDAAHGDYDKAYSDTHPDAPKPASQEHTPPGGIRVRGGDYSVARDARKE
jgi:hypothetical protein